MFAGYFLKKMYHIISHSGYLDKAAQGTLFRLYEAIFDTKPHADMQYRLARYECLLLLAIDAAGGEAVGFKLGYEEDSETFYSWLGGVLPEARGQHLALRLMETQHTLCRERGYRYVRTNTLNRWRNMLIINIKSGFDIIGTQLRHDGTVKILMEKKL
jgi:ribosomal protein S18 acetylase RimI-like enzyme